MLSKSYAYLLNFEQSSLVFTDQNGSLLEIEHRVNLTLLIGK